MSEEVLMHLTNLIATQGEKIKKLEGTVAKSFSTVNSAIDPCLFVDLPSDASIGKTYLVTDKNISGATGTGTPVYYDGSDWVKFADGDILT